MMLGRLAEDPRVRRPAEHHGPRYPGRVFAEASRTGCSGRSKLQAERAHHSDGNG